MFKTLGTVVALLLSYGLLLLANGLFSTLLGVRTQVEGFSPNLVGFIVACYFAGLLLGGLFAARVVTRVGHIRSFAAFASVMSVSALLLPIFVTPFAWMAFRMLGGFCMAGMIMVTESWLNEAASNKTRGKILSFYMITNYFAAGCGQFLLNVGDPSQFELFSLASIIFSLALLPVLLTRAKAPVPVHSKRMHVWTLYRIAPLGVFGVFCCGLVNSSIHGLGPVYATNLGFSEAQLSTFMAAIIMSGLFLQWPIGHLSDRIGRGPLLAIIPVLVALAAGSLIFATEYVLTLAGAMVFGAFVFTLYSLAAATTNDMVTAEQRVQVAGALLITYGAGAASGPIIAGQFMSQLGPQGLFFYFALINLLLATFAILMRGHRAGSPDKRKPFVAVPATQATSNQLYLSAHDEAPEHVTLIDIDEDTDKQ
ncbi:MAG: MFS transporter [Gammaproteobacteria bacterium]|nr:MFS transporter [Gammaproteobacteria bacterium]